MPNTPNGMSEFVLHANPYRGSEEEAVVNQAVVKVNSYAYLKAYLFPEWEY